MPQSFGIPPRPGSDQKDWLLQPLVWGFLQPCLLLLLAEKPRHGYILLEELRQRQYLGGGLDTGNLYRTLRRMEGEGFVASNWNNQEDSNVEKAFSDNGRGKRVYCLTSKGQDLLRSWGEALEQRNKVVNQFMEDFHSVFNRSATQSS